MLCRNTFAKAFFLGVLVMLSPSRALSLSVPSEGILGKGTERRLPDPVLIQGKSFPGITGGPLGNYRVSACQTGQFLPIRFQIDEMTEEGDFIFPYGKLSNIKESNGILDERDVLLFMAKDAGDRVSEAYWPENASKSLEIEIVDPVNNASSWVYLFLFDKNPPPLCPLPDYFSFDYETDSLASEYWKQRYYVDKDGFHTNYHDHFSVLPKAGGNGENFVDRLKIRAEVKLFFGRVALHIDEETLMSNTLNVWIQGPVRVIRRMEHYVKGPFGMKLFRALADLYYYETMSTCPIHLSFPFKVERLVSSCYMRIGTDYSPEVIPSMYYSNTNPQGVLINGKMDETDINFNPAADQWRVMTGKWGSLMTRNVLKPETEQQLEIVQGITDDAAFIDPPEKYP
jgi:hypothetical protein